MRSHLSACLLLGFILVVWPNHAALHAAPKIGVLLKAKGGFWGPVEKGAIEAGQKFGVEVIVKAPLTESDIGVQIQLLNALAAQGISALVIAPDSKDALAEPVALLAAKGVKIVVIDSPLAGKTSTVFVGTDHHAAGVAAGRIFTGLVGENDEVCIFKHNQSGGATEQREIGATETIRDIHPHQVVHADIYASTEKGVEIERSELLLSKYPQTKAILASGTAGTLAMLKVLQQKKPALPIKLVGFGFNLTPEVAAALEAGTMQAWVAQQPKEVGYKGVECALALLNSQSVPEVVHTDFVIITSDNLKDPKVQALLSL